MRIDKPEISGLITLFIGVGLLIFTFLNAYWFLAEDITIVASQDLVRAFGEALAPLVATCIHIMYLGIMGWIGSLLTLRGIPLLTHPKTIVAQPPTAPVQTPAPQKQTQTEKPKQPEKTEKPPPQPQPAKPEAKPKEEPKKEPEISIEVRPPEEVTVETSPPTQSDAKQQPPPQP